MDKKLSYLFLVAVLLLLQPLGFAEQEVKKTVAPEQITGSEHNTAGVENASLSEPTIIPENPSAPEQTIGTENGSVSEPTVEIESTSASKPTTGTGNTSGTEFSSDPPMASIKQEKTQQKLEDLQQEQEKLLQLQDGLSKQQKMLDEQKQVLLEKENLLENNRKSAAQALAKQEQQLSGEKIALDRKKQELSEKERLAEEQLQIAQALQVESKQKNQTEKLKLAAQAKLLHEKERIAEQKIQLIEQHWLNKSQNFITKNLSNIHSLYLLGAVILFFVPFILLVRSRRKQNLAQLPADQDKDYVADTKQGTGQRKVDNESADTCQELPVVQVVEASSGQKIMDRRASRAQSNVVANKPFIWLAIIAIPFLLYFYLLGIGVHKEVAIYSGIIAITLIMWMSSLLPEFIPALIGLLLVLLFGLAPNDIVLSGFSSPGFLLLFSVMGLGAVITSSGLTHRYTLWLIKSIPANLFANQFAIFLTGLVFNPIVPTINGRAMIVAPILRNIVKGWDEKTKTKSATPLYTSGLDGINFLSPIFLTAAPANLMIYGLLPSQEQQAFEFMFWIYAASIVGITMFLLYFLVSAIFFHSFTRVEISKEAVEQEWKKLGTLRWCEWIALVGIFLMAVGIASSSIHKVPIPLITFGVLCAVLVIGVLSRDQFIKQIDWSFLVLLASMIGILATMTYLGIDKTLVTQFSWLGEYMRNDFHMFVLVLTGMILLVRIFIPLNSAILIFAAALLPLAAGAGISAWVVGFIILIMCGTAFFGYQSPYILYFRSLLKGDVPFIDRKYQLFQLILVLVKLAAIYASIPFWIQIGVL